MRTRRPIIVLVSAALVLGLAYPTEAHARGFFRGLFAGVRKVVTFVVDTPAKIAKGVTRPLGPVLGPIASEILLAQLPSNVMRVVDKAERVRAVVKDVETQQARIDAGKRAIRDQRARLSDSRAALDAVKEGAAQKLASGEITYKDYRDKIADIGRMKAAMDEASTMLEQAEKNLRPENLARLVARDALKRVGSQAEGIIFRQLDAEVSKLVNPEFIERVFSGKRITPDEVIGLVLEGDIKRVIRDKSRAGDEELIDRVRDDLRQAMKDEKDLLKGDWRERLAQKIDEVVAAAARSGDIPAPGPDEPGTGSDDGGEAAQAAGYYGDLVCAVSDPAFWEGFAEAVVGGMFGDGSEEPPPADDEFPQEAFLRRHGFLTEEQATAAVAAHWGTDAFIDGVLGHVRGSCPKALENADADIESMLRGPRPF